ncbi:TPA: hypothetical protein ACN32U_004651, partial [Vibrio parahaemolyticus]
KSGWECRSSDWWQAKCSAQVSRISDILDDKKPPKWEVFLHKGFMMPIDVMKGLVYWICS